MQMYAQSTQYECFLFPCCSLVGPAFSTSLIVLSEFTCTHGCHHAANQMRFALFRTLLRTALRPVLCSFVMLARGRNSSVGIATPYELDGPGIEFRWRRDFPHPSRSALGPTSLIYNGYRVSFPGVKRPGRGVNHPPHLASRLKKE